MRRNFYEPASAAAADSFLSLPLLSPSPSPSPSPVGVHYKRKIRKRVENALKEYEMEKTKITFLSKRELIPAIKRVADGMENGERGIYDAPSLVNYLLSDALNLYAVVQKIIEAQDELNSRFTKSFRQESLIERSAIVFRKILTETVDLAFYERTKTQNLVEPQVFIKKANKNFGTAGRPFSQEENAELSEYERESRKLDMKSLHELLFQETVKGNYENAIKGEGIGTDSLFSSKEERDAYVSLSLISDLNLGTLMDDVSVGRTEKAKSVDKRANLDRAFKLASGKEEIPEEPTVVVLPKGKPPMLIPTATSTLKPIPIPKPKSTPTQTTIEKEPKKVAVPQIVPSPVPGFVPGPPFDPALEPNPNVVVPSFKITKPKILTLEAKKYDVDDIVKNPNVKARIENELVKPYLIGNGAKETISLILESQFYLEPDMNENGAANFVEKWLETVSNREKSYATRAIELWNTSDKSKKELLKKFFGKYEFETVKENMGTYEQTYDYLTVIQELGETGYLDETYKGQKPSSFEDAKATSEKDRPYVVVKNPGGGNCMFLAIAYHFVRLYDQSKVRYLGGKPKSLEEVQFSLRKAAVSFWDRNRDAKFLGSKPKDLEDWEINSDAGSGSSDFGHFLFEMGRDGVWGNEHVLQAFSTLFNWTIVVIDKSTEKLHRGDYSIIEPLLGFAAEGNKTNFPFAYERNENRCTVFLAYSGRVHYEAVKIVDHDKFYEKIEYGPNTVYVQNKINRGDDRNVFIVNDDTALKMATDWDWDEGW